MEKIKLNSEYFFKPKNKLINNWILRKYSFNKIDIYDEKPCIYISPMVSVIDYNLITKCLNIKFVFLKNEIVAKINANKLDSHSKQKLSSEINDLTTAGYSIAFLWNNSPSIFGENEKITESLAKFLHETKLDVKFLTFPGEFFAIPMWSEMQRNTKIFASQKIKVEARMLEGLSIKEIVKVYQNSVPASATQYSNKYPIELHSNCLATGLERVMYACPNCKKLLSLYSECSCIKCKACGSAIELSKNGEILFTKNLSNFDDIEKFQFMCLKHCEFNVNKIIEYNKLTQILSEKCKKPVKINVILQIYAEKMILINPLTHKKTTYYYEDIEEIDYSFNNSLLIKTKNAKQLHFFGNSNENLLIIKDLVKINKN